MASAQSKPLVQFVVRSNVPAIRFSTFIPAIRFSSTLFLIEDLYGLGAWRELRRLGLSRALAHWHCCLIAGIMKVLRSCPEYGLGRLDQHQTPGRMDRECSRCDIPHRAQITGLQKTHCLRMRDGNLGDLVGIDGLEALDRLEALNGLEAFNSLKLLESRKVLTVMRCATVARS